MIGEWVSRGPLAVAATAIALCVPCTAADARQVAERQATPVFRLGGVNAAAAYAFAQPPRLVVDVDGYIYARLPNDGAVSVFDPDGRFVRTIGRKGEGPGEFQVAAGHGLLGDTLWVINWPTPRVSRFLTNGTHIATSAMPVDYGHAFGGPAGVSALLRDGRALIEPPSPVLGVDEPIHLPVMLGTPDMRTRDTIAFMPTPRGMFIPSVGVWTFAPIPTPPLVAVASNGSGIAIAEWSDAAPGVVDLRLVSPRGTERWRRSLRFDARVIPASVRDSLIAVGVEKSRRQIDEARRLGSVPRASAESLVERGLSLPRHFAPVGRLVVGIDGTVWLEQMAGAERATWLVLDPDGRVQFQVQVPAGFTVEEASMHGVWGTEQDEWDVAYLVRLRVDTDDRMHGVRRIRFDEERSREDDR